MLADKYFVDELYERVHRPAAALDLRPRVPAASATALLLDGTLNGLAALAQRAAGGFGRVQTGNLHLYAFLVLAGIVGALAWSWRHG